MENKLYNDTLLTEKGYEAANKAANGQGSFVITRTVASENAYKGKTDNELRQLTHLDNEIPGSILDENTINTKMTAINTGFSNELNASGYVANTIGLYAKLDGGDEFLYSVTPSTNGQIVPKQDNNVFTGMKLTIYVLVGNSQKLEVILSPGGDATIDYVNKAVSKCKDDLMTIINQKENIVDHNEDIKKLRNTINDDIQPKLDKKVTFNGGNITTGNGTFVPAAIGDVVKDNHDGTITYNGNNYAINKTINSSTDYNNITTPGTYLCILSSKWPNTPLAGTGISATVILKVENDNAGDVFQTAYAPAIYKTITRQYSFGKWSVWKQLALQSDVDGLTSYIAAVESDKNKKEYASDHVNDMNGLRSATMIVRDSNYSDSWSGLLDGGHLPGWYYGGPNSKDAPEGWSGYGSGLVWGAVDIFGLLIDNTGKTWSGHKAGWGFTGWKRLDNQEDLINLQNRVNGVLARQSDLIQKLLSSSFIMQTGVISANYDISTNIVTFGNFNVNQWNTITVANLYQYALKQGYSNIKYTMLNGNNYGMSIYDYNNTTIYVNVPSHSINIDGLKIQIIFN